jgi:hypothetical protein
MTFRIEEGVLTDMAGNENVASKRLIFTNDGSGWKCEEEPEPPPPTSDMEFGGTVSLKVNPDTGETNSVSFTTLGFRPGAVSTFTLSGFDATASAIADLQMWFVVGETIGGTRWYEKVNTSATYNSGVLTVTLPGTATTDKSSGGPYRTFFIFGVDNKAQ